MRILGARIFSKSFGGKIGYIYTAVTMANNSGQKIERAYKLCKIIFNKQNFYFGIIDCLLK